MKHAHSLELLYEDNHLVVIDKPAGWLSQGGSLDGQASSQEHSTHSIESPPNIVDYFRNLWGRPYVGLVHRLDRNTSGLMVVAKRSKAASRLSAALQEGQLNRSYLAWVVGTVSESLTQTVWVDQIEKDSKSNRVSEAKSSRTGPRSHSTQATQEARMNVFIERLAQHRQLGAITLLKCELETGRSHQIRVQCSLRGYPLVGDIKYGGPSLPHQRLALHSNHISFPHPVSKAIIEIVSELPSDISF